MARLIVDGPDLVVGLSWLEKLGAVHGNVRVPLRAVRSAAAEPDPWTVLRGSGRLAGTGIPGTVVLGTRYFSDGRGFAAVTNRPAVRVELGRESPFARLLVSVSDAESTVAAIRGATGI